MIHLYVLCCHLFTNTQCIYVLYISLFHYYIIYFQFEAERQSRQQTEEQLKAIQEELDNLKESKISHLNKKFKKKVQLDM